MRDGWESSLYLLVTELRFSQRGSRGCYMAGGGGLGAGLSVVTGGAQLGDCCLRLTW